MVVDNLKPADSGMSVIMLKDICPDPEASVERLVEALSAYIDTLANTSHQLVVDPSCTKLATATMSDVRHTHTHIIHSDY